MKKKKYKLWIKDSNLPISNRNLSCWNTENPTGNFSWPCGKKGQVQIVKPYLTISIEIFRIISDIYSTPWDVIKFD